MMGYEDFLKSKRVEATARGLKACPDVAPHLFPFQRAAVEFGVRAGSWGLFFDTGLCAAAAARSSLIPGSARRRASWSGAASPRRRPTDGP